MLVATVASLAIRATLACGSAETPGAPASTPTASSASSVVGTPVPRSDVETAFEEPLSSGLSVADVVENALPSVVHIIAGSGTGTGFIINEDGLVVTNKHVVEGSSRVAIRLAAGTEYQAKVTQRLPALDLAYIEIDAALSFLLPSPLATPTKSALARRSSPLVSLWAGHWDWSRRSASESSRPSGRTAYKPTHR